MTRVLVICPDVVDTHMAGAGVRYWEMSRALGKHYQVTLAIPNQTTLQSQGLLIQTYDPQGKVLKSLVEESDAVLIQGFVVYNFPFLKDTDKPLVVDLCTPILLENLEVHTYRTMAARQAVHSRDLSVVLDQIKRGDFFICANERQRDYWLGMLTALGRVNPHVYEEGKHLRNLIDVVPFGFPEEPPRHLRPVLKGVFPGISSGDRLLLWGGGVWPWFDPLSLVQAMHNLAKDRSDVKLFFLGRAHPNPEISAVVGSGMYSQAVELSKKLGLHNRAVFFHDQWVPYSERQSYLLEADVGICLHQHFVETRFAFRTRLMDYIWTGLPMVVSAGDSMSEIVSGYGLGHVVACGDMEGLAGAIRGILALSSPRETYAPNFAAVRERFTWSRAVDPLRRFLAAPQRAADVKQATRV